MTNKQQNKLKMAETVQEFFTKENTSFSQNAPLQQCINDFKAYISDLQNHATVQSTDTTAHTEIKDINRENLIKHIVVYSNAASVYFSDKNSALSKQFKIAKSKLLRQTGTELKALCNNILDALNQNIDLLNPQYVTPQNLNDLQEKINLFDAKTYDTSAIKGDTQNATKFIKQDLKNIGVVLGKIDQLMLQYTLTNEELYSRYRIARKTLDLGKNNSTKNTAPTE